MSEFSSRAMRLLHPLRNISVALTWNCFNLRQCWSKNNKVKLLFKNSIRKICDVSMLRWYQINPMELFFPSLCIIASVIICFHGKWTMAAHVAFYCRVWRSFLTETESLCMQVCLILRSDHNIFKWLWSSTDFLVEKDNDYCVCQTPCNMTRYGKELSMVKIPSKASAKYLAKKFNKTEQYIG